jgi:hypothetical protein
VKRGFFASFAAAVLAALFGTTAFAAEPATDLVDPPPTSSFDFVLACRR